MSLPTRFANKDLERGQALVLLAMAFVGIAAFVGLTVDAGILFTNVGHLRRATDAASLSAANQFREGRTPAELSDMACEFLQLNGVNSDCEGSPPPDVVAKICDLGSPGSIYDDPSLCPVGADTPRKYVNVETTLTVNFAFLPIIGWGSTEIRANSISEAASVDLVLVLDISASMSYNLCNDGLDNDEDGQIDDCSSNNPPDNVGPPNLGGKNSESDVAQCIANRSLPDDGPGENVGLAAPDGDREDDCHPFEEVRDAAHRLVDRMYFPYDRLGIVTIGLLGSPVLELDDDDPPQPCGVGPDPNACAHSVVDSLDPVLESDIAAQCPNFFSTGDPRGCGSTNTGHGMSIAAGMYCRDAIAYGGDGDGNCDRNEMREEAVWVALVLSDGVVNAAAEIIPPTAPGDWWCPNDTWAPPTGSGPPYCQDGDPSTRHADTDLTNYDADDYARDWADFLGCPSPPNATCLPTTGVDGGQGVVIFTIGLGEDVTNYTAGGAVDQGEKLLRYIAAVGDDGDPATDPCSSAAVGDDCGNYYFVLDPGGGQLLNVFEAIASRIFTRITH